MLQLQKKRFKHERRATRVRKGIHGTPERPRLSVHRTLLHTYAQIIDDVSGRTLVSASTTQKEVRGSMKNGGNRKAAVEIGTQIAARAKEKGITKVVFDRGGFAYHGRIKDIADAARKAGLQF
ncbi:MAG: 50S ribosomal protein L18 [Candidatus Brocadiae bacterium]|nr:50S ribosomal protein L18 [Candidatus Brocadiia bacterium]